MLKAGLLCSLLCSLPLQANQQLELILFRPASSATKTPLAAPELDPRRCPAPKLRHLWHKLNLSPDYQTIQHLCWQPRWVLQSQAEPIQLDFSGLSGELKVFSGRQLHIQLNLKLSPSWHHLPQFYFIHQEQSLTENQVYYLDSPDLGFLVLLSDPETQAITDQTIISATKPQPDREQN